MTGRELSHSMLSDPPAFSAADYGVISRFLKTQSANGAERVIASIVDISMREAFLEFTSHETGTHSDSATPFAKGELLSIQIEKSSNSCVPILLLLGSYPATICRFVVSVIINAINRVTFGRFPTHVSNEAFDPRQSAFAIAPTVADFNPSSSVILICRIARIVAARQHIPQRSYLNCAFTLPSFAMFGFYRGNYFTTIAATRFCSALYQSWRKHRCFIAAITYAVPSCFVGWRIRGPSKNDQSSISIPGSINKHWHLRCPPLIENRNYNLQFLITYQEGAA